jgi:osmoprotectant transport system substrate-binding protein
MFQTEADLTPDLAANTLTVRLHHLTQAAHDQAIEQMLADLNATETVFPGTTLPPLGFNNSFAMVVSGDSAREPGLRTLSEAARRPRPWRLGVGYEFTERPDGLSGLVQTYGLRLTGPPVAMDLGLLYPALQAKRIEMAAANATDGMLARPEFVVLEDDKHYFPPYECAIVVRQDSLKRFPRLRAVLGELSGRISDSAMRRMNEAVDVGHRPETEVARDLLNEWK